MLKRAGKKADLEDLKLHQHSFRKLWITCAINLGLPEIVWKILTFKSVDQSLLTYYMDRQDLRGYWKRVVDFLTLEPQANGRVNTLTEAMDLVVRSLRKMCLKELQAEGYGEGLGLIRDLSRLTHKEVLEKYLKEA